MERRGKLRSTLTLQWVELLGWEGSAGKVITFFAFLASAVAFVPVSQLARSSSLKMSYTDPIAGALAKAGGSGGWDPLGLLNDHGGSAPEVLRSPIPHNGGARYPSPPNFTRLFLMGPKVTRESAGSTIPPA